MFIKDDSFLGEVTNWTVLHLQVRLEYMIFNYILYILCRIVVFLVVKVNTTMVKLACR